MKMRDEDFGGENQRSDLSEDEFDDEMEEEDNFDFLLKRTQGNASKITEDITTNNGTSLEVQPQHQLRASTVYVKKQAPAQQAQQAAPTTKSNQTAH